MWLGNFCDLHKNFIVFGLDRSDSVAIIQDSNLDDAIKNAMKNKLSSSFRIDYWKNALITKFYPSFIK